MTDFVEDLVDYQHLVEIEDHRLNVYRQLWELVSYSLSIDKFSLIYTHKEDKLFLDINNTSVRYKIWNEDKKTTLKCVQVSLNHQKLVCNKKDSFINNK